MLHVARRIALPLFAATLAVAVPAILSADTCPTAVLQVAGLPFEEIPGPNASGGRQGSSGSASFYFREYGDSSRLAYGNQGSASLSVRGRYRFLGPPTGTSVGNQLLVRMSGYLSGAGGDPYCEAMSASGSFTQNGAGVAGNWSSVRTEYGCYQGILGEYTLDCVHPAGTEFLLASDMFIYTGGWTTSGSIAIKVEFGELPPGAFMVRCDGDTTVQVVGVEPATASGLRIASIWPNPSRGEFHANLAVPAGGPAIVRLLDLTGRVVESRAWDASRAASRQLTFGPHLAPGFYFLQVSQGAVSAVREVVIRR